MYTDQVYSCARSADTITRVLLLTNYNMVTYTYKVYDEKWKIATTLGFQCDRIRMSNDVIRDLITVAYGIDIVTQKWWKFHNRLLKDPDTKDRLDEYTSRNILQKMVNMSESRAKKILKDKLAVGMIDTMNKVWFPHLEISE